MALIVQKFGGTSVGDLDRIRNVAARVQQEVDAGHQVAVVVSAMAGTTNQLVSWARDIGPIHDAREYDTIVASGEQVTVGLLAIALQNLGIDARSWLGWQVPVRTDDVHGAARIDAIDTALMRECLVAWCILLLMFILGEFLITRYSTGLSVLTPSFSFPLFCRSCGSGVHVPDEAL